MTFTMRSSVLLLLLFTVFGLYHCKAQKQVPTQTLHGRYITISRQNPNYFAYSDGTPYIPIGINLINPSAPYINQPDSGFAEFETWMKTLSQNGGNYIRVWLSNSFFDIEETAGRYSEAKAARIDRFIEMARKYHLKIKLTFEHFRSITLEENPQAWATKFAYHRSKGGPLDSVEQYITSPEGRQLFLNKVAYYKKRYGSDTLFFGWELWNEMNAMSVPRDSSFFAWNEKMLAEVKRAFPHNLVMQSLGSFDAGYIKPTYERMMRLPGNEVAQVHRYLDLGAAYAVCHAPMDVICASAVQELRSYQTGKPVLLAETGAVEPHHAGPSRYYPRDTAGILLHDMLFAPFFSGSAGTGMSWHWESYVHKNNLWYHYGRFHKAIEGINPIEEHFSPSLIETDSVRVYILKGKRTTLVWLRDKSSNWQSELDNGIAAGTLSGIKLPARLLAVKKHTTINVYDPWQNKWSTLKGSGTELPLPDFKRSLVLRFNSR